MKIAIVGTGIAGNVAAYKLRRDHDITVYESAYYVGGHTNTIDVREDGRSIAVDTGRIQTSSVCSTKSARTRSRVA